MSNLFSVSSEKAATIRTSTKVVFLLIGFSLIVMEIYLPPAKPLWFISGNILGIILIIFSIVGLTPRLRISWLGKIVRNTGFHIAFNSILGMGIIIAAMVHPPAREFWYAYFNIIGILLVFDAIITSSWHATNHIEEEKMTHHDESKHLHPPTA